MKPITKSQAKKNRGAIPVSFIAVLQNVLERIMNESVITVKGVM